MVEFTLAFPLLALVFFAVLEFGHLFYVKLTLRHALGEAGRYAVTGRADVPDKNTPDPDDTLPRCESIDAIFKQWLMGTGAGLQGPLTYQIIVDEGISPESSCGGPMDTVRVTAQFVKPWFTVLFDQFLPKGVTFNLSTTWVNEPFS